MRHIVTAVLLLISLAPARSPASEEEDLASVHFNTQCEDFGTPVRVTNRGSWDANLWRVSRYYDDDKLPVEAGRTQAANNSARRAEETYGAYHEYRSKPADREKAVDRLYVKAFGQTSTGRWRQARETYLALVALDHRWTADVRDRVSLLDVLIAGGRLSRQEQNAVHIYFHAFEIERVGSVSRVVSILQSLTMSTQPARLNERAAYELLCCRTGAPNPADAELFHQYADQYPSSPMREECLIMLARHCLLQENPDEKTINLGLSAIQMLRAANPRTRFYKSSFGLQARAHFLRKQYADAMWCYLSLNQTDSARMVLEAMPPDSRGPYLLPVLERYLSHVNDSSTHDADYQATTVRFVNQLRLQFRPATIDAFRRDLDHSPALMASYIYYRLYYTNTRNIDIERIAEMARLALSHHVASRLAPRLQIRLAEAEYQLHHYQACLQIARSALAASPKYDRALLMQAGAEYKLHRYRDSERDLQVVLKHSTDPPVRQTAREQLALAGEAAGDIGTALDQYYALDYLPDINYLLDVRMSTAQLEQYARHSTRGAVRDDWQLDAGNKKVVFTSTRSQIYYYTLGIRYMREGNWVAARKWLQRLPARVRHNFDTGRRVFGSTPSPDALDAVNDLERLQAAVSLARGQEAKARAEYRYASYFHTHGDLLLYNPMLWNGARVDQFENGWNEAGQTKGDSEALRRYFALHEPDVRARELCLAIANRYPASSAAPKALYRAACASEHIGALALWYARLDNFSYRPEGEASMLMRHLVKKYPHSELAALAAKYADVFAADNGRMGFPSYAAANRSGRENSSAIIAACDRANIELEAVSP